MSDEHVVVLNVACGSWFPKGQQRLKNSLEQFPEITFKGWKDEYPPGCNPHQTHPYQFKTEAIAWALRQGFDVAIWADASTWFVKNPRHLVRTTRDRGCWFCTMGWNVGQWCSDKALPATGMTREELFKVTMVAATFYAIDLKSKWVHKYLEYMRYKQPHFAGPYRNDNGEASANRNVGGHRHDQTFLSIFAYRNDMIIDKNPCFFAYAKQLIYGDPESAVAPHDVAVAVAQGM